MWDGFKVFLFAGLIAVGVVVLPVPTYIFFGSFIDKGQGSFKGRLVDVGWEGVFFKSCEAEFQYGDNSSRVSYCSSYDPRFCQELSSHIGQSIQVHYTSTLTSGFTRTSKHVCVGIEDI